MGYPRCPNCDQDTLSPVGEVTMWKRTTPGADGYERGYERRVQDFKCGQCSWKGRLSLEHWRQVSGPPKPAREQSI